MCGSLPTLRVFLKHVAPRVLGDKSQNKPSQEDSASFGLHTFGGSNGPRRKFDTLVELEHDMHFNRSSLRPEGMGKTNVKVFSGQSNESLMNQAQTGDDKSEDGILQTRTTTVQYEYS
jgi:hypothetical protein